MYWVVWHVINYNSSQVIVILITFLITFSQSLRKMCYDIVSTLNENQNLSLLLFNISISFCIFLKPPWISTVTFHLLITDLRKESNMHVFVLSKLLVCDGTQAESDYNYYLHDTHASSVGLCTLIINTLIVGLCTDVLFFLPSSVCHSDSLINVS